MNLKKMHKKICHKQIEVNLIVFEIIIVVAFQSNFHLKMYQNNIYIYIYICLNIYC